MALLKNSCFTDVHWTPAATQPVPPVKITLLASACFVHHFPLPPRGCCLEVRGCTRGTGQPCEGTLEEVKVIPAPWPCARRSHCAAGDLGAAVNSRPTRS